MSDIEEKIDELFDDFEESKLYKDYLSVQDKISKDKEIRNGKAIINGTRITPKELMFCIAEKINQDEKKGIETNYEGIKKYLSEEYPSITNEEQIQAALYYTIKYEINIFKYIIATLVS